MRDVERDYIVGEWAELRYLCPPRERDVGDTAVLLLEEQGRIPRANDIAARVGIDHNTVRVHLRNLRLRTGAKLSAPMGRPRNSERAT